MTRNEARDQIVIFMCDEQKVINDRDKQALDMAIKALKQEPCEDAINRQAVMDCFKKWQPYMATRLHEFEKELSELPSVAIPSAEPKTGHWIDTDEGFSPCECSECKSVEFIKSKFCPNCGAKMMGVKE